MTAAQTFTVVSVKATGDLARPILVRAVSVPGAREADSVEWRCTEPPTIGQKVLVSIDLVEVF